jgi:hypothetical protein
MRNTEAAKNCKEYLFQCDCHSYHFLHFTWWPEDKFSELMLEGYLSIGGEEFWYRLGTRAKHAWKVLLGRHFGDYEVLLNEDKAEELHRVLELFLADARAPEKK